MDLAVNLNPQESNYEGFSWKFESIGNSAENVHADFLSKSAGKH
jgi:hypothetical protein